MKGKIKKTKEDYFNDFMERVVLIEEFARRNNMREYFALEKTIILDLFKEVTFEEMEESLKKIKHMKVMVRVDFGTTSIFNRFFNQFLPRAKSYKYFLIVSGFSLLYYFFKNFG